MANVNPGDVGTATSTAGAATLNHNSGTITTESLSTAHGTEYTMTLTNACITPDTVLAVTVADGTNTTLPVQVAEVLVSSKQAVIKILNGHASAALNGTILINFAIV